MTLLKKYMPMIAALLLAPLPAFAAVDTGDTAWLLISSALVMLMTPGLALFYAGMVRPKNAVSTLYQNVIALGVVGLLWVIIGYSFSFGTGTPYLGGSQHLLLEGVGQEAVGTATIPLILFAMYQMMFAIITPALMTGAFAERMAFKAVVLFLGLWSLVVYAPVAHAVWGPGGWLAAKGALDFAGGFVVHMTAGYSALVAAIVLGKRKDTKAHKPYDIGMIALGTSLLWFGWFGFNAGSALGANGLAAHAFTTTFISAAVAMLAWTLVDTSKDGKPTLMGGCIGVVAGLVAITPAAGFVTVQSAIIIGLMAGVICNLVARAVKGTFKVDDTLDVFACHGVGGTIGVIMTGLLGTTAVNAAGANGLLNGSNVLFQGNITAAVVVAVYSMVATYILLKLIGIVTPLRVTAKVEDAGLDESIHGEKIAQKA